MSTLSCSEGNDILQWEYDEVKLKLCVPNVMSHPLYLFQNAYDTDQSFTGIPAAKRTRHPKLASNN